MSQNLSYDEQFDPPPISAKLNGLVHHMRQDSQPAGRHMLIACIMAVALFAFEVFNYDTTRYALSNLIGDVRFAGITWASILAIAFCSIDFAGLIRMFTPDSAEPSREAWYLMGAWLLGATMNAMMTWWAVSLTLLNHEFGNEILSREALLRIVPIFVAVLVWLTRVLFIGAITYSGEMLRNRRQMSQQRTRAAQPRRRRAAPRAQATQPAPPPTQPQTRTTRQPVRIVEKPNATPRRAPEESLFVDVPPTPVKAATKQRDRAQVKKVRPKSKPAANPKPKSKPRGLVRPKPQRSS